MHCVPFPNLRVHFNFSINVSGLQTQFGCYWNFAHLAPNLCQSLKCPSSQSWPIFLFHDSLEVLHLPQPSWTPLDSLDNPVPCVSAVLSSAPHYREALFIFSSQPLSVLSSIDITLNTINNSDGKWFLIFYPCEI